MSEAIVVVNAGSTSLKFAAYAVDAPGRGLCSAAARSRAWKVIPILSSRTRLASIGRA